MKKEFKFYVSWRHFYGISEDGREIIGGIRSAIKTIKATSSKEALTNLMSSYWSKNKSFEFISKINE